MSNDDAFWKGFLAKREEIKGKPRKQLLAELHRLQEQGRKANSEQAAGLEEMRAIVLEFERMVQAGQCDPDVHSSLAENLRATEASLAESRASLERLGRLVDGLANEPSSSN